MRLRSDAVCADVLPAAGGRITGLVDARTGREALWSSPVREHRAHPPGTVFDDVFAGGWDELLPDDEVPDHGELWTTPLTVLAQDGAGVTLAGTLPASGLEVEKRVAVAGDEVVVELRIVNPHRGPQAVRLKLHPALRIATGARIVLPGVDAQRPDPGFGRVAADFRWPEATGRDGAPLRVDVVPPEGPWCDWLVLPEGGRDGRCGLVHEDWAVTLAFDAGALPALWLFADYGGWQGSRFLLLEPATDSVLAPGAAMEIAVRCRLG